MRFQAIALLPLLAACSAAHGAFVWSPSSGSNANFSYANGSDTVGLLGTGNASTSGFFFSPANFISTSSGTGSNSINDAATVDVTAASGRTINSIGATILGDYSVFGVGGAGANATITVTNLDTNVPVSVPLVFTGTPVITTTDASGVFSGIATLPAGWTHVRVNLDATLTTSSIGGTAVIQAKDASISINTSVPEPTTVGLAAGAIITLLRRRRA